VTHNGKERERREGRNIKREKKETLPEAHIDRGGVI
jgi:hypothetical protein